MINSNDAVHLVIEKTKSTVVGGPFVGLKINPDEGSFGNGLVVGQGLIIKLLGFMEQELHPHIEKIIKYNPSQIVNLGCAEGYYAVGLGLRIPSVPIVAVDIDLNAIRLTTENAQVNGIADRLSFIDLRGMESLEEQVEIMSKHDLKKGGMWIVDIEGAEAEVLDIDKMPVLETCSIIVETHDHMGPSTLQDLKDRFSKSHNIEIVGSGGRNPNQSDILKEFPDDIKWAIMSEGRLSSMEWLVMIPKNRV